MRSIFHPSLKFKRLIHSFSKNKRWNFYFKCKNAVKEKHTTEGKSNKKDKRGNDGKMRERHISGHSTPGAKEDPGDSTNCKDEGIENLDGKDRLIKKLMDVSSFYVSYCE